MSSFVLKIIAEITMFIDHLGYTIFGKFSYLNYIGCFSNIRRLYSYKKS